MNRRSQPGHVSAARPRARRVPRLAAAVALRVRRNAPRAGPGWATPWEGPHRRHPDPAGPRPLGGACSRRRDPALDAAGRCRGRVGGTRSEPACAVGPVEATGRGVDSGSQRRAARRSIAKPTVQRSGAMAASSHPRRIAHRRLAFRRRAILAATRVSGSSRASLARPVSDRSTHMLALIPCGIKAGILRRGKVESCHAFVLEQLQMLLLNW